MYNFGYILREDLTFLHTPPTLDRAEPLLLPSQYRRLFDLLLIILLIFAAVYFTLPFGLEHITAEKYDMTIVSGFVLNGVVWFILLIVCVGGVMAYSLEIMHWTFCLFFFSFAPLAQYKIKIFS